MSDENSQLKVLLEQAIQKINWFEEQVKLARQQSFGKSNEALSSVQEEIIFNAIENLNLLKEEIAPASKEKIKFSSNGKKLGRKVDTAIFPRQQQMHDLKEIENFVAIKNRTSDPPPGNMVMWRGFTRLVDIQLRFNLAMKIVGN